MSKPSPSVARASAAPPYLPRDAAGDLVRCVVAFSCKRGVCSSCAGRRMSETAANLVEAVVPEVPVRQWVLSMPFELRYRLAYDRALMTPLLGILPGDIAPLHRGRVQRCRLRILQKWRGFSRTRRRVSFVR